MAIGWIYPNPASLSGNINERVKRMYRSANPADNIWKLDSGITIDMQEILPVDTAR